MIAISPRLSSAFTRHCTILLQLCEKHGLTSRKAMIDKSDQFDFLRELVEGIPDPVEPKATATRRKSTADTPGRRRGAAKDKKDEVPAPDSLPAIGTWGKREPSPEQGHEEERRDEGEDDNYDDY